MTTVEDLLVEARRGLERIAPEDVARATEDGALLIDIRSDGQRARDGRIPTAHVIERNVLEWRCDPASPWHDEDVGGPDRRLILICNEGYQSSLAAATLQRLGLVCATDVVGGFCAWRAAGLPVVPAEP